MKKTKWVIVLVAILALGGAYYGYTEYNRKAEDTATLKVDVNMEAEKLVEAYETDEDSANKLYLDKVIKVSGTVTAISSDSTLTVYMGNPESISGVSCEMSSGKSYEANQFVVGTKVEITGLCSGYLSDVVLRNAVLNEKDK